jgi:hypothetical protein
MCHSATHGLVRRSGSMQGAVRVLQRPALQARKARVWQMRALAFQAVCRQKSHTSESPQLDRGSSEELLSGARGSFQLWLSVPLMAIAKRSVPGAGQQAPYCGGMSKQCV